MLEFLTFTKAVEYLIGIIFLLLFTAFWIVLHRRGRSLVVRLIPIGVMTLALGFTAVTCALDDSPADRLTQASGESLVSSEVLVEMYGPAHFDHQRHQDDSMECTTCHHMSGHRRPPCNECHLPSDGAEVAYQPNLTSAYHLRCIGCHIENQIGYTDCLDCHTQATVPPLSIKHPLSGADNCVSCHAAEIPGVPALPADHTDATNGVCQICHHTALEPSALATRAMPHQIAGLANCLMCHGEGIGNAAKIPDDHAGRTVDTCQICHDYE